MEVRFTKMHGCGNDYIYIDCRKSGLPQDIAALARQLSARRFSVGGDGVICICAPETPGADGFMRIFNADGSEGEMCGNGVRCVAQWLREHEPACSTKQELLIDTLSGCKRLRYQGDSCWQVEMGRYSAMAADLPAVNMGEGPLLNCPLEAAGRTWQVSCISVGNPHCVTIVDDPEALRLEEIGSEFENHKNFPKRINTEFVKVFDPTHLQMRVWERGSGETCACGTGACATAAALTELGLCPKDEQLHLQLRGGELIIKVLANGEVLMTGPAKTVCEGVAQV